MKRLKKTAWNVNPPGAHRAHAGGAIPARVLARARVLSAAIALGLSVATATTGCSATDVVFSRVLDAAPADAPDAFGGDATVPTVDGGGTRDGGNAPLCTVDGAALGLNLGDGGTCLGDLAARAFRFALCVCGDAVFGAGISSETVGAGDGGASASIGVNGNFITSLPAHVGGSLWTRAGLDTASELNVRGELHCASNLRHAGTLHVTSDAWVGGPITTASAVVRGTLTQPAGTMNTASIVAGARRESPVASSDPCDCEASRRLPVAALVDGLRAASDNLAAGFHENSLANVQSPATVDLPCGRLFASRIHTDAPLTLRVGAPTVLAVGGDVTLGGDFVVELTTGTASLDLLLGGAVAANGVVRIGSEARPSAVRVYVAGTAPIAAAAAWVLHGNLYAPGAVLQAAGGATFGGAVFVSSLAASAPVRIGYDPRVLEIPDDCAPPAGCTDCRDCKGQACVGAAPNGHCGACTTSNDCCAPLVCAAGRCIPEAPPR